MMLTEGEERKKLKNKGWEMQAGKNPCWVNENFPSNEKSRDKNSEDAFAVRSRVITISGHNYQS